jgi:hypothetical protein
VYLEKLKLGLTNVEIKDDPNYFNVLINGAKVTKAEKFKAKEEHGRSILAIPKAI